jgi:cytoskeletal protein CcmA (bactofilin family)
MFKRDQAVKPTNGQPTAPAAAPSQQVAVAPIQQAAAPSVAESAGPSLQSARRETGMVNIGKSVVIKGELEGSEDLTIEGQIEGTIRLKDHVLTIGPNGRINAQVFAKSVIVVGTVRGNITASEKVDIRDGASVDGDVVSPRVAIAEGAQFHGSVDMQRSGTKPVQPTAATAGVPKPTPPAVPTAQEPPRAAAAH